VIDYESSKSSDLDLFAEFHRAMLQWGVYLPPSQFEAVMVSAAHTEDDVRFAIDAAKDAAGSLAG
jgi:glutamate-1-semialdehyde 2,1-aminomutase